MSRFASSIPSPILFYLVFLVSTARSIPSYFISLFGRNRLDNVHFYFYIFLAVLLGAQEVAFPIFNSSFNMRYGYEGQCSSSSYYGPGAFLAWYLTAASICCKYLRINSCQPSLSERETSNAFYVEPELVAVFAYAIVAFADVFFRLIFKNSCVNMTNYAGYTVMSSVTDLALISFMVCAVNHHSKASTMIGTTVILSSFCHVVLLFILPFGTRQPLHWQGKMNVYFDQNFRPVLQNVVLLAMVSPRVQPVALWKRLLAVVSYSSSSITTKLVQGTFLQGTGSGIGDLDQIAPLELRC